MHGSRAKKFTNPITNSQILNISIKKPDFNEIYMDL